jgi:hypothetical protein
MRIHFLMGSIDIEFTIGRKTYKTITAPSYLILSRCDDACIYKPLKIYGTKRKRSRKTLK